MFVCLRLALGTELLYQRAGDGMQNAVISLGGYYRAKDWEATAKLGLHSMSFTYQQRFRDYLTLVADVEGSLMQVGYGIQFLVVFYFQDQEMCLVQLLIRKELLGEIERFAWCNGLNIMFA